MAEVRRETFAACARFDEELQAHLEGESRPFIIVHSRECTSCGALLAELNSVRDAAQHLPLAEPSPAVWAHVRAQLAAEGAFAPPACAQFGGELEAYLEGEQQPFVLAHAHECNACGTLLADLQAIQQAARALPLEEPSPAVWTNVQAKLLAEGIIPDPACRAVRSGTRGLLGRRGESANGHARARVRSVWLFVSGPPIPSTGSAPTAAGRTLAGGLGQRAGAA